MLWIHISMIELRNNLHVFDFIIITFLRNKHIYVYNIREYLNNNLIKFQTY